MVVHIEVGGVELSVVQNDQNLVVAHELAQIVAALVIVQSVHIVVEPHLSSAQGGAAPALQSDALHLQFGEQVSDTLFSLDVDFAEIAVKEYLFQFGHRFECHLDDFGLTVRIGSEVSDA